MATTSTSHSSGGFRIGSTASYDHPPRPWQQTEIKIVTINHQNRSCKSSGSCMSGSVAKGDSTVSSHIGCNSKIWIFKCQQSTGKQRSRWKHSKYWQWAVQQYKVKKAMITCMRCLLGCCHANINVLQNYCCHCCLFSCHFYHGCNQKSVYFVSSSS